ncbi:MAG: hypothetical protein U0936_24815 [Planctomycetaceae bacterium]
MPIRRSVLSAIGLLVFGAAVLHGQQHDPFAEWDRQSPRPTAKKGVSRSPKTDVKYFSPKSEEASSEDSAADSPDNKALEVSRQRMRERIQSGNANKTGASHKPTKATDSTDKARSTAASASTSKTSAKPAAMSNHADAEWDVFANGGKPKVGKPSETPGKKSVTQASSSNVKPATYGDTSSHDEKRIIQVSQSDSGFEDDSESPELAEEENPFASYLEKSSASKKSAEIPAEFSEEIVAGDEEEKAEALLKSEPASSKAVTAAKPTPSKAAAQTSLSKPSATKAPATKPVPVKTVSTTRSADVLSAAAPGIASADSGPQSPGITVQWVRRGEFNVGQECDVDLVVQNTSKSSVRSVMTEAIIPDGLELVEAKPPAMEGSETPTWTFGELKPGETRTVAIKVIPRQRGDVRLDAFVRMTGFSSSEFSVQEPMISVEVSGPETVEVGQQAGYVVKVSNPGTGLANNVVIQAAIPEGLNIAAAAVFCRSISAP